MTISLDEWRCWPPGSKLELLNGQLIVSDGKAHPRDDRITPSRLLLSHLLRGWGLPAVLPFAPLSLWWDALAKVFGLPTAVAKAPTLHSGKARAWAEGVFFEPELLQHKGNWRWAYSQLRQDLRMVMYCLEHDHGKLGKSLGGGFVNRLGEDGLMPDICFYRGESRNRLYEYFIDGPPEIVVELLQPGSERYGREVKRNCYEAAGVPGLTFFPKRLWEGKSRRDRSLKHSLFEVGAGAQLLESRIPYAGKGLDETRGLVKLQAQLEPEAIAFDDYIYWCPEAKFEFMRGQPWLGGREGTQGLLGLTFGFLEVIKLAHPQDWVEALLQAQSEDKNQSKRQAWWKAARQQAQFLRDQFGVTRVAVVGELAQDTPLDYWSKLVLAVWNVPDVQKPYTSIRQVVEQMSADLEIQLIFADCELSDTETQLMGSG